MKFITTIIFISILSLSLLFLTPKTDLKVASGAISPACNKYQQPILRMLGSKIGYEATRQWVLKNYEADSQTVQRTSNGWRWRTKTNTYLTTFRAGHLIKIQVSFPTATLEEPLLCFGIPTSYYASLKSGPSNGILSLGLWYPEERILVYLIDLEPKTTQFTQTLIFDETYIVYLAEGFTLEEAVNTIDPEFAANVIPYTGEIVVEHR
jgi:hypothetical protein